MHLRPHKIMALLAIFLCLATPLQAGSSRSLSAEIEAAFLVQFSKYISWPAHCFASPTAPVIIGILGRDPFGSKIDQISRSFNANGRGVEVRRLADPEHAKTCHILFVSASKPTTMESISRILAGRPIVLVSSTKDFLARGGMINFITLGTKIRFDINLTNCRHTGIKISSKLLKIAHRVTQ